MTLTINLSKEEESRLKAMAARAGVDQATLIRQLIGAESNEHSGVPKTPAEAIEYWRLNGVLGSYGDPAIDSPQLAREIRRKAEARERS